MTQCQHSQSKGKNDNTEEKSQIRIKIQLGKHHMPQVYVLRWSGAYDTIIQVVKGLISSNI